MASNQDKKLAALRKNRGGVSIRREGEGSRETHRLTLDLDADLHKRLAMRRVEGKGTVKAQIEEAVREYLSKEEPTG